MITENLDNYEPVAKIVVIGVGGAGNNAVNRMIDENIMNVDFYVANTDKQALSLSKAPNRIILGQQLTSGLGAGGDPEIGRQAAEESIEEINEIVKDCKMVFIASGMGGGTGTGACPVIADCAKKAGALTIAIVTRPFSFEGNRRLKLSVEGLNNLRSTCDAVIVVSNDNLLMYSGNLPVGNAFSESDKVLSKSVQTVTDLILMPSLINLDFNDVDKVLKDSGIALIGFGTGSGTKRAEDAALDALSCPLIEQSIKGARKALCHITCGNEVSLFECQECVKTIREQSGGHLDISFGIAINDQLTDQIMVSLIAGDFDSDISFDNPSRLEFSKINNIETTANNNLEDNEDSLSNLNEVNKEEEKNDIDEITEDIIPNFLNTDLDL
ncbi:MAG: cell division protein FtsZ [Bacillales bacterium]